MPVPSTNTSLDDIQTEFGGSNPISLSEYYSGGPLVPAGSPAPNGPIPSSGQISIGEFRGSTKISYITATGGTTSTASGFKYHKFTGPGTFTVSALGTPGQNHVDVLVVGGGGGGGGRGGNDGAGGGGAGGFRQIDTIPVTTTGYPVTIGSGAGSSSDRQKGQSGGSSAALGYTS